MPNYENNNLHGTLYVTFDVEFPKQEFTSEEKEGKHDDTTEVKASEKLMCFCYLLFADLRRILAQSSNNRIYNGLRGS